MKNILIGCTGSVATLKLPILINELKQLEFDNKNIEVKVVVTEHATHFFSMNDIPDNVPVLRDADEWSAWSNRGDPVVHIDLAKWADIFVIAPLDANTLGKLANGLCDNLLTCVARAWDHKKPFLFCPAMNTKMWEHPITDTHITQLQNWGYRLVPCVSKTLICGDTGLGAMAEVTTIIEYIKSVLNDINKP